MGWLRDLMLSSGATQRSFGDLARSALADAGWPDEVRIRERSLATVLSKLDRDLGLEWLEDRPAVQGVLARVLKCSVSEIAAHARPLAIRSPERQLRWSDLRFARSLDLVEEELPPGLPAGTAEPSLWGRRYWVAPSGSGRSLAGSWLAARGLARFVRARRWQDALPHLGVDTPLFVELDSVEHVPEEAPSRERLCVAAPAPPRRAQGWNVVTSPPVDLEALVEWVAARLPADGSFDPRAALEWLNDAAVPNGIIDGLGVALGLCGALDELGLREVKRADVLELGRRFARRRFDDAFGSGAPEATWLRRNAMEVLAGMAKRALTDDREPFAARRSLDEWIALVPDQHKTGFEVEWLRLSLARVSSTIRATEIERAARRISPGAFRIVRGLQSAGLLVPADDERFGVAPRWLGRAAEAQAHAELLDGSAFEWGEALLRPHAAAELVRMLFARVRAGTTTALSDVLELETEESPAFAVALTTTFVCAGLALLLGSDVDSEQLEALWREQVSLTLSFDDGLVVPRVEHPESSEPLLSRGAFHLALLAISEELSEELPKGPLAPWSASEPPAWLAVAYDAIRDTLIRARELGEPWVVPAYLAIDRLRSSVGAAQSDRVHPLERPGVVLDEIEHSVLEWSSLESLLPADGPVLLALGRARGRGGPPGWLGALWHAWHRASPTSLDDTVLSASGPAAAELWTALPVELASAAVAHSSPERALPMLSAEHWAALLSSGEFDLPPDTLRALADHVPQSLAATLLERLVDPAAIGRLWRRFPELVRGAMAELGERGLPIARAAPHEQTEPCIDALAGLATETWSRPGRAGLERWLHDVIAARRPGFRKAFSLLSR